MNPMWTVEKFPNGKRLRYRNTDTEFGVDVEIPEADVAALILFLQTCGETWKRGEA